MDQLFKDLQSHYQVTECFASGAPAGIGQGAVRLFFRTNTTWTQSQLLVGAGGVGSSAQGASVSLSLNARALLIGGPNDSSDGAGWVFTQTSSIWDQGTQLVGTGVVNNNSEQENSGGCPRNFMFNIR